MALEERIEFGTARQEISADEDFTIDKREELKRVDLACGQRKKDGFIGVDAIKTECTDVVHDLMKFPWPFEDASIYEFNCEHFVEHIPIQLNDGSYGLVRFMEEVWRCLKPMGTIQIIAPYYASIEAWQDPTHVRAITDRTFLYFDKDVIKDVLDHYTGKCNFKKISNTHVLGPEWNGKSQEARSFAMTYYWNVIKEIHVILRKVEI